jgi:hypothetical protein
MSSYITIFSCQKIRNGNKGGELLTPTKIPNYKQVLTLAAIGREEMEGILPRVREEITKPFFAPPLKGGGYNTRTYREVTYPSTTLSQACLTADF